MISYDHKEGAAADHNLLFALSLQPPRSLATSGSPRSARTRWRFLSVAGRSGFAPVTFQPLRSRMDTKVMMGFMRTICVILCLIISTTTAYAGSILWSKAQASTRLEKDERWLEEALLAEKPDAEPLLMETTPQETTDDPEEEADAVEVMETIAEVIEPEGTETISSTPSEIDPPEEDIEPVQEEDVEDTDLDDPIEGD